MRARLFAVLMTAMVVGACTSITSEEGGLDVDAVLGNIRDCEEFVDVYMGLVLEATEQVDRISIEGVAVDIDEAARSLDPERFFEGTRSIGCNQEDMQALVMTRLEQIRPGTATGSAFLQTLEQQLASR